MSTQPLMNYARAAPNKWTFTIEPIAQLLRNYIPSGGLGWADPFSGMNSPAQYTNDINMEMPTRHHLLADEFCDMLSTASDVADLEGVIFDQPYSYRQITECYTKVGLKASQLDTSSNFYNRVMNAICDKIKPGGLAISFGWNTNGFGINRGFHPIEILVVAHGQHHNDTLVVVEKKRIRKLS